MSPEAWSTKLNELVDADLSKFCFTIAFAAGVELNLLVEEADEDEEEDEEGKLRMSHKGTGSEKIVTAEEFKSMTIGEYITLCQFLAGEE
jgi:hypothetical protein